MSRQNSTCPSPPVLPNGVLAPNSANMSARSRQAQQINVQTSCGGANFVRKIMTLPTTIGSFNFADNQINATVPFSKLSFFTTQTNNITFGNTAVTISLGGFNLLNTVLSAANPSSFVQLFPLNTGNLQLGNSVYLTAVGNFLFVANTLQSAGFFSQLSLFTKQQEKILFGNSTITMTIGSFNFTNNQITATVPSSELNLFTNQTSGITIGNFATPTTIGSFYLATNLILSTIPTNSLNLFTNQSGSIVVGNPNITCNIGSFNLMNKRITTTAPNDLITILDTQIGGITMGHLSGPFTLKASTANINATTSATITSPSTNINATTKVDITTPNLNVKASNGNSLEVLTEANDNIRLDFHSQNGFTTDFDACIACLGGGSGSNQGGTLNLAASTTNFNNLTTINANTPTFNVINGASKVKLRVEPQYAGIEFNSSIFQFINTSDQFDTRIYSNGGTPSNGQGSLSIEASTTNINATTKVDITTPNLNVKASNGNSLEVLTEGNDYVRLDFHSNSLYSTDFDSRIASIGGTASDAGGTLNLASGTINFNNATTVNSNTPQFMLIYGGNSLELNAGGNAASIDFHSNSSYPNTDWDARIISQGGSSSAGGGALYLNAEATGGSINIDTPTIKINNNLFRYVPSTSYTPRLSTGSNVILKGSYSITGNMMTVRIILYTGGNIGYDGNGIYKYSIPSGYKILSVDFNSYLGDGGAIKLYDSLGAIGGSIGGTCIGSGYIQHRGYNTATICVLAATDSSLVIVGTSSSNNNQNFHSNTYYPLSLVGLYCSFTATFPIVETILP